MKTTYNDFITQNPTWKDFDGNTDAEIVFRILSQDFIITQLIDMSGVGKPALAPVAENVGHFFMDTNKEHINSLDDNFTKQAVGLMVKTILDPFGYAVWKQKDLPKSANAVKFQSASVYRRDITKKATMRVTKHIEEV